MKRLIVALMLLWANGASAKTLIVAAELKNESGTFYDAGQRAAISGRIAAITNILDLFGASYKVIPAADMRTEWARTGVVTWNFGTTAAYTESFDAVIHAMFVRKNSGSPLFAAYRPDSLTLASKLPIVPQLMLPTVDGGNTLFSPIEGGIGTISTCSTAVVASGWIQAGGGTGSHDEEGSYYSPRTRRYYSATLNLGHANLSLAAANTSKGVEVLLAQATAGAWAWNTDLNIRTAWGVPLAMSSTPDTAEVWMVRNVNAAGKSPIIYANIAFGAGDGVDPGGLAYTAEGIDYTALMVGMAALDSASGGRVFDNKSRMPLKVGITVDGLCSRSSRTNSGGIVPSDTANFYATIDSIAAVGVPVVFGVNLDSMSTYGRDLQYVRSNCPKCRFTPQTRAGLDTSAAFGLDEPSIDETEAGAVGGNNRRHRPIDTFRRFRNISSAYGPAGGASEDTSLYASLSYAIYRGDSTWGYERSSRFAMPPSDDWSPYNLRGQQVDPAHGATVDSILFAYAKAGFRGIRINPSWTTIRPDKSPNNPLGFQAMQGSYPTADCAMRINLVGHQGGYTFGNFITPSLQDSTFPVSLDPGGSGAWDQATRFWNGVFRSNTASGNLAQTGADGITADGVIAPCRIFKTSAQELAGSASTSYKTGLRPGWWGVRMITEPIAIINQVAGRTLMQVDDPARIVLP